MDIASLRLRSTPLQRVVMKSLLSRRKHEYSDPNHDGIKVSIDDIVARSGVSRKRVQKASANAGGMGHGIRGKPRGSNQIAVTKTPVVTSVRTELYGEEHFVSRNHISHPRDNLDSRYCCCCWLPIDGVSHSQCSIHPNVVAHTTCVPSSGIFCVICLGCQ